MFYRKRGEEKLIVVLYVDDGLVAASKKEDIKLFLSRLQEEFKITIEPIGYFLGIHVDRKEDGSIFIDQQRYAEDVLRRFNMADATPVSTPIEQYLPTEEVTNVKLSDAPYRQAIGCLMYLAVGTRPDVAFAVSYVSQFLGRPEEQHWSLVKRIMKYLRSSSELGILYRAGEITRRLQIFSDADFASDPVTRRSVSGMVSMYSGGAITWMSRRQQCVSLSTTEAEFVAASEAARETVWLSRLFGEMTSCQDVPILLVDNMSAIKLSKNPELHKRSKHIDVRFRYVRERIHEGDLAIQHVCSDEEAADILTKPISRVKFVRFRSLLGMIQFNLRLINSLLNMFVLFEK